MGDSFITVYSRRSALSSETRFSHFSNIRNNPDQFGFTELEGRHGCPRNAVQNSIPYVSIGRNSLKLSGTQVNAGNQIAVFTMARRALAGIDSRAVLNVGLCI